jgi:hypothetical protein
MILPAVIATAVAPSTTQGLPNASFHQAAASLLAVLLLTGAITEARNTREQSSDDWEKNRWNRRSLFGFICLSLVVLVGELASLTVLLRQSASEELQLIVGVSLILGLLGVPGLVLVGVAREVVGVESVRRWIHLASLIAAIVAAAVVASFLAPSLINGEPGVGTPTRVAERKRPELVPPTPSVVAQCVQTRPAVGVPRAQAEELEALWFSTGSVGTRIAGCPTSIHVRRSPTVLWIEGIDPATHEIRSLGIAGQSHAALLLGDAAKIGIEMLNRGELLGASQRLAAGQGDLYVLYTRRGAAVLLRRTVGTNEVEQPYVLLPPSAASAWLGAVKESAGWLWPSIERHRAGILTYRLAPVDSSSRVVTVLYNSATGEAIRGAFIYPAAPPHELNVEELEAALPTA